MRTGSVVRLGTLGVAIAIGLVVLFLLRERSTGDADALRVGDCLQVPAAGLEIAQIEHRPCNEPHEAEVFHIVDFPAQDTYPLEADLEAFYATECLGPAFDQYTGLVIDDAADIEVEYFPPAEAAWSAGRRMFVCYLFPAGGGEISRSYRAG
jgi:hypothetical protein